MLQTISLTIVTIIGIYFVALGCVALFTPNRAESFLLGFATTRSKHYLELLIRTIAGAGFVLHAPQMQYSVIFASFGWILLGTTLLLAIIPWRWHEQFAKKAVPAALQYLWLIGLSSLGAGLVLLYVLLLPLL